MNLKSKIIYALIIFSLGAGTAYFAKPAKVVEVVKKEIVKEEAKTRIVYRNKVTKPDGTITETESSKEETVTSERSKEMVSKETINRIGLIVQALAYAPVNSLTQREYGVIISKRVIGNLVVGAMATSDKKVGITLGLEF